MLFTATRHRMRNTEYIPPGWMTRMHLTPFRIGMIAILLFVFSQRQIDLTVSLGKDGFGISASDGRSTYGAGTSAAANPATPVSAPGQAETATLSLAPAALQTAVTHRSTAPAPAPAPWSVDAYDAATVRAYVNRFERVARTEEEKFSIPAAAKMALAILESDAGRSSATKRNNNHFGRPLAGGAYPNAWANWRAHSELLNRDYPQLANESVNHQQWIAALARTGYSNDGQLEQKLLAIVARFGLDRL